jgi:hypothetical protein
MCGAVAFGVNGDLPDENDEDDGGNGEGTVIKDFLLTKWHAPRTAQNGSTYRQHCTSGAFFFIIAPVSSVCVSSLCF